MSEARIPETAMAREEDYAMNWLIERYIANELHYWEPGSPQGFTRDVNDAVRFCREQDAMRVLFHSCGGLGRVASHGWIEP